MLRVVAFLSNPSGPLGGFWAPPAGGPHDSLHRHVGLNYDGLLAIEYGFHVTLVLAGLIIAYFYLPLLRQRIVTT